MTAPLASRFTTGVVVSAGKMKKAVKVQIARQEWNKRLRKDFPSSTTYLVSDPNSSLREGDVISIASGWRTSRNIRHVVSSIIAPFGPPVEARPPVPTTAELLKLRETKRLEKDVRQAARGRTVSAERVKVAETASVSVPSLEHATRKIKALAEAEREKVMKGQSGGVAKSGQSAKERREEKRNLTDGERKAMKAQREAERSAQLTASGAADI